MATAWRSCGQASRRTGESGGPTGELAPLRAAVRGSARMAARDSTAGDPPDARTLLPPPLGVTVWGAAARDALTPLLRDRRLAPRPHDAAAALPAIDGARTELALPRLGSHLVLRLSDAQVQLATGAGVERFGHAVVLASRTTAWRRVLEGPVESVGLELAPWELEPLLGVSAGELAGQHHALVPLARSLREHLLETAPHARAAVLQAWADERLARAARRVPASIVAAWAALKRGARVRAVVAVSGASHRHFAALFLRWTGLLPGEARGLARFERAVGAIARGGALLADVADEAGYADQSHLTRDLRARCGLSPAQLAAAAPFAPGHLDEGQLRSRRVTDRVRRSRA